MIDKDRLQQSIRSVINQSKQTINGYRRKINTTQEAILSLEKDAQNVLRSPEENRKWDSKDKDARFK